MPTKKSTSLFKVLLETLREHTETLGQHLSNEQISNLTYAFRKILPKTPDEIAFVIAVGLQQKSIVEVVKKYLRNRKKENNIFIPFHKVRHAQKALKKSWGVLLYKEQAEAILEELTGKKYGDLPATIFLDVDVLSECLTQNYRQRLTENEIEKISKNLRLYTKIGFNVYAWCLDVAERVLKAAKET